MNASSASSVRPDALPSRFNDFKKRPIGGDGPFAGRSCSPGLILADVKKDNLLIIGRSHTSVGAPQKKDRTRWSQVFGKHLFLVLSPARC